MESDRLKLFLGGISRETTGEVLRAHFSRYGDVVRSDVAFDRAKGRPRGFGFVTFSHPDSADQALRDQHAINGRTVDVKRATPKDKRSLNNNHAQEAVGQPNTAGSSGNCSPNSANHNFRTKKIFVGGLASNLTQDEFRAYFERFGALTDVVVLHDSVTHRPRGFGFITFDSEDSVDAVLQNTFHDLNGKTVEVKRAVPKEANTTNNGSAARMAGRGSPRFTTTRVPAYQPYAFGGSLPYNGNHGGGGAAAYTPYGGLDTGSFPGFAPLMVGYGGYFYDPMAYGGLGYDANGNWLPAVFPEWSMPGFYSSGVWYPWIYSDALNSLQSGGAEVVDMGGGGGGAAVPKRTYNNPAASLPSGRVRSDDGSTGLERMFETAVVVGR